MSASQGGRPVVVVGVDGSDPSKDALRWAAGYAAATGATVRAVSAWQMPPSYVYAPIIDDVEYGAITDKVLQEAVDEVFGPERTVAVTTAVVQGPAAQVLLEQSRDADLLVVGSSGHGAFSGMLLGSVSQHCVQHARCPVVVVRHTQG